MAACLSCHQYLVGREDRYCGLCGAPCARLEVENGGQITISGTAAGRITATLKFRNAGQSDISVAFIRPAAGSPITLEGELQALELRPFSEVHEVQLIINAGAWPMTGPQALTVAYRTNASGLTRGEIRVTRGQTKAVKLAGGKLDLGTISVSASNRGKELSIEAENPGATRQRCELVKQRPDSKLLFSLAPDEDGWLFGYSSRRVRLRAEPAPGAPSDVQGVCELRFVDENNEHPTVETIKVQAQVATAAQPQSAKVSFGRVLPRQVVAKSLIVRNLGSEPFELTNVTPDTPMLRVLSHLPVPVLGGTDVLIDLAFSTRYCEDLEASDRQLSGAVRLETTAEQREVHVQWEADILIPREDANGILALDFGTTNSCVAYHSTDAHSARSGWAEALRIGGDDSPYTVPSLITFVGSPDIYLIGAEAQRLSWMNPGSSVDSVKRMIAGGPRQIAGATLTPVDMATRLIEQILLKACACIGKRPTRIAITVPATFWGPKRDLLKEACEWAWRHPDDRGYGAPDPSEGQAVIAGDDKTMRVRVIDEPTAAAFYFLIRHPELFPEVGADKLVMVCDFGGGTFDVSVVSVCSPKEDLTTMKPLLARGNAELGGLDLDVSLLREMSKLAQTELPTFWGPLIDDYRDEFLLRVRTEGIKQRGEYEGDRYRWLMQARGAKHELSRSQSAPFRIDVLRNRAGQPIGSPFQKDLKRQEFKGLVLDRFCCNVRRVIFSALKALNKTTDDIAVVLVTGQTSRIPAIRKLVKEELFSKSKVTSESDVPLKESVAIGAAELFALQVMQSREKTGYEVTELTKSSYRYGLLQPTGRGRQRFVELMPLFHEMGTPTARKTVPLQSELGFGELTLVQNESEFADITDRLDEVQPVGKVKWQLKGEAKKEAVVTMQFAPGADGRLEVTVDGVRRGLTIPEDQEKSYL